MLAAGGQVIRSLTAVPLIIVTHVLYGLGFWRGLFTKLAPAARRPEVRVALETLQK